MFPKASPAPLKKLRITNFQGKTQYDALCRAIANTRPRVETVSTERTASGSELNLASLRISDIPALSTEPCQPWVNVSSLHTVTVMTASPSTHGHCCSAGPMPGVENHRRHRRHPSVSPPGIKWQPNEKKNKQGPLHRERLLRQKPRKVNQPSAPEGKKKKIETTKASTEEKSFKDTARRWPSASQ